MVRQVAIFDSMPTAAMATPYISAITKATYTTAASTTVGAIHDLR